MTGFRVAPAGWYGVDGVARRPVHLRQGDGRRAARRGVRRPRRRDGPRSRRPGRSTRRARCRGNPLATAAGLATLRALHAEVYAARRRARAPTVGDARQRRADRRRASPHRLQRGRQPVQHLLRRPTRSSTTPSATAAAHRRLRRVLPRDARRAASTCRRRRTRRGSSPPPTTTRRSTGSPTPLPRRGRGPPATIAARLDAPMTARTGRCRRTTVHLVRHGEVYNPDQVLYGRLPGFHLSDHGRADGRARGARPCRGRDVAAVVASPLERAQETAAPIAAASRPRGRHRRPADRGGNDFEGTRRRARRRASLRTPSTGGTCATRSGRRGASPTSRSRPRARRRR